MAQGKKTFIFYSDWINMIREMPDKDAGELLKHILSYVNDENPETDNPMVKMAFGHMKPLIKSDLQKWEKQIEKYSEMGKKSAEKRKQNSTYVQPKLTKDKPTSTVNVNVNDNVLSKTSLDNLDKHTIDSSFDYDGLLKYFNAKTGRNESWVTSTVKGNVKNRLSEMCSNGDSLEDAKQKISLAIRKAATDRWLKDNNVLTLVWITSEDNFYKWLNADIKKPRTQANP